MLWKFQAGAGVNAPPVLLYRRRQAVHRRRGGRQHADRLQARQQHHRVHASTDGVTSATRLRAGRPLIVRPCPCCELGRARGPVRSRDFSQCRQTPSDPCAQVGPFSWAFSLRLRPRQRASHEARGAGAAVRGLPWREWRSPGQDDADHLGPDQGYQYSAAARLQNGDRKSDQMTPVVEHAGKERPDGAGRIFFEKAVASQPPRRAPGRWRNRRHGPIRRSAVPAATRPISRRGNAAPAGRADRGLYGQDHAGNPQRRAGQQSRHDNPDEGHLARRYRALAQYLAGLDVR